MSKLTEYLPKDEVMRLLNGDNSLENISMLKGIFVDDNYEPTLEEVSLYCKRRHYVIITAELFHFLADGVPGITPVPKLEQMYGKDVSGVIVSDET